MLKWLAAAAAIAGMSGEAAAQGFRPCLQPAAAEALMLVAAPDALRKTAELCAPLLPANAALRRSPNPMLGRFAAEAESAWPAASGAIGAIAGEEAARLLDSEYARPMLATLIGVELTKQIKPESCGAIDRIIGLIEPLPPRNAAALIVTIIQLSQKPGRRNAFTVCTAEPQRR